MQVTATATAHVAIELTNPLVSTARGNLAAAKAALRQAVIEATTTCQHEHIAECAYRPLEHMASLPTQRVCLSCGLSEVGWGCGFLVLKAAAPQRVERDDLYRLSTCTIREEHKGPLLRREAGLAETIRQIML